MPTSACSTSRPAEAFGSFPLCARSVSTTASGSLGRTSRAANAFPAGVAAANFDHVLAIHREVARQQIEKEHAKV